MSTRLPVCTALFLAACAPGEGDWVVETWGEDYIERHIPAEAFADGCEVTYDAFVVVMTERQLVDGDGNVAGDLGGPEAWDLRVPGPTPVGTVAVPADHYSTVRVTVGPATAPAAATATDAQVEALGAAGASVLAEGTLACGGEARTFRWAFHDTTTYTCAPEDLTIPAGGADRTELTVHGDHLFYDGLADPDAGLRGEPLFAADADADGEITLEELDRVSIPELGYAVGPYSEVVTLRQFVAHLARTLLHVDGEGECLVDL